jgi:hypothetical protein
MRTIGSIRGSPDWLDAERKLRTIISALAGFNLHDWQVEVALCLHFGIDVSCVAGTGSGKSIAFQATCLLNKDKIGIIICPLIALMKDQVCWTTCMMVISNSVQARSLDLLGIKAIALTDETLAQTPDIVQKIEKGNYSLVYISPERTLAKDGPFWKLLGRIKRKIYYVVVDECHLVVDWGSSFRPDYANIASLRGHVGKVPFAALTATATREKMKAITASLKIKEGVAHQIRRTCNRPNCYYVVDKLEHGTATSMNSLRWMIPQEVQRGEADLAEIPMTLVYADSLQDVSALVQYFRSLLPKQTMERPIGPFEPGDDDRSPGAIAVDVMFSLLTPGRKELTYQAVIAGQCRLLCATDVFGPGINIPGIQRVWQWKASNLQGLDALVQRWGRCARSPDIQGLCGISVEPKFFGSLQDPTATETTSVPAGQRASSNPARHVSTPRARRNRGLIAQLLGSPSDTSSAGSPVTPLDSNVTPVDDVRSENGTPESPSRRQRKTKTETRQGQDKGLHDLINAAHSENERSHPCRRNVILEYYQDPEVHTSRDLLSTEDLCCDLCPGRNIDEYECGFGYKNAMPLPMKKGVTAAGKVSEALREQVEETLESIRDDIWKTDFLSDSRAAGFFTKQDIIGDAQINTLAGHCRRIQGISSLAGLRGFHWGAGHRKKYGELSILPVELALRFITRNPSC